jgi:hypothetical protein
MSYACHNVTQLDRREANIFIVISSVGMSLSISHVVKHTSMLFHDPCICATDVISSQLQQVCIDVRPSNHKLL